MSEDPCALEISLRRKDLWRLSSMLPSFSPLVIRFCKITL